MQAMQQRTSYVPQIGPPLGVVSGDKGKMEICHLETKYLALGC